MKLFPSHVDPPAGDPHVARVLLNRVRLERTRQFGACWLGLKLWKRLELDRFFEAWRDDNPADVPWSRIAALLAINRLCAPGSELAVEQRWYALRVTLKHLLQRRPAIAPEPSKSGVDDAQPLSPMRALALLTTLQSADIVLPTTDGREIRLRRITEPEREQKSLLHQLRLSLPDSLRFQPKCNADSATA